MWLPYCEGLPVIASPVGTSIEVDRFGRERAIR